MEVVGIGSDICQISRIAKILKSSYKNRFLARSLHPSEMNHRIDQPEYVAGRWAVKESAVKATGRFMLYNEIATSNLPSGAPTVKYYGKSEELIKKLGVSETLVTITHEKEYAVAFLMLMKKAGTN